MYTCIIPFAAHLDEGTIPDTSTFSADRTLPDIPVIDATGGDPVQKTLAAAEHHLTHLIEQASGHYGRTFMAAADRLSRRWIERNTTPFGDDIAAAARHIRQPGVWFLNASFEWSCTCGAAPDPETGTMRLLRVLDWPLNGLGTGLIAARQSGPAGDYVNLTWPGFAGVVTALAPGRFAAAINQAPMPRSGLGFAGDWMIERTKIWRTREPPPMHLLRQVFERCGSYADARHALTHTPIALPAIITLVGNRPDEGCVIERFATKAHTHDAPVAVANHWLSAGLKGHERGIESVARLAVMETLHESRLESDFKWLKPPVLNETTRLAAVLDPARRQLRVQGFEADGPATTLLSLDL